MRPYERERADAIRQVLIERLGGKCSKCGKKRKLEFHHIYGCTWRHNKYNRYQRLQKYQAEYYLGLISLLCSQCNKATPIVKDPDLEPF